VVALNDMAVVLVGRPRVLRIHDGISCFGTDVSRAWKCRWTVRGEIV
jgi:hypothetical protein